MIGGASAQTPTLAPTAAPATPTPDRGPIYVVAIRNVPTDERVHTALSIGPIDVAGSARGRVYVATHVDVIPPRKDDGAAALKRLAEDSRRGDGNVRFEVVQHTGRNKVNWWLDFRGALQLDSGGRAEAGLEPHSEFGSRGWGTANDSC